MAQESEHECQTYDRAVDEYIKAENSKCCGGCCCKPSAVVVSQSLTVFHSSGTFDYTDASFEVVNGVLRIYRHEQPSKGLPKFLVAAFSGEFAVV